MRLAVVCSAHGFGHLTRQLALVPHLQARGAAVTLFTAAPPAALADDLPVAVVPWTVDVGIRQHDSLTEDLPGTLLALAERHADPAVDALATRLRAFDAAIVDVAPAGLEAARRAGIPAVAVGSFSWPWIYDHYPSLQAEAARLRRWQAPHPALSLWPGPGLPAGDFRQAVSGGLIGRHAAVPHRLPPGAVLVSFGGLGLSALERALPRIDGVCWVLAPPMPPLDRPDCLYVEGVPYPALVAGAHAVLTKPGYGIFAEAALARTRLLWVERGAFPEAPFLAHAMHARGDVALGTTPDDPRFGAILGAALRSLPSEPPQHVPDDTEAVAGRLWRMLCAGEGG